jgi:hypothetical protein
MISDEYAESIGQVIKQMIQISEQEFYLFRNLTSQKTFKRQDIISLPGRIPNEIYFIYKGLIRVLITDYEYNKSKKPAPPCNNDKISADIIKEAKQMIINNNLDQPEISKKLFKDMGDQFTFEQSMHSFHTTPNTTIPNDQNGFAEFCYGNMTSCKEGNLFACARNLSRYQNY